MKLGLRSEYTDRAITPEGLDAYRFNHLDFYPSAYFTYRMSESQQFQINYSRRVERPRDFMLNPVALRSDGTNTFLGNPNLTPEHANSYELNYQYRFNSSFISLETYYRKTDDIITRITTSYTNDKKETTVMNLDSDQSLGAEVMANLKLTKWWSINPSYSFYYYKINGNSISNTSNNWRARVSNNIKVLQQTSIQLDGMFNSATATLYGKEKETYFVNAAIRQELFKRKASITFSVSDIFQTRKHDEVESGVYRDQMISFYDSHLSFRQAPVFKLSISYTFNNYKKSRTRNGDSSVDYGDFM